MGSRSGQRAMSFESAGYQLLPVLPELVLAAGALVLLMLGAYRGRQTSGLFTVLPVCLAGPTGGLELRSLAPYVGAASNRDNVMPTEAGLKYFVLGALSSGMLLYGASLIYGFTGSVSFAGIAASVKAGSGPGLMFGLVFLLAGLAF